MHVLALSFNQPKLCPIVSWQANGTTFANVTMIGIAPIGMFIDKKNTIYVNDRHNNRVQIWSEGETEPTTINPTNLNFSSGIFVTNNGDIYLDNGKHNSRVDKWSKSSNNSELVMYVNGTCFGLFVDTDNNLYCSLPTCNRVVKRSLDDDINTTITVAGNGTCGLASHMLCHPTQIFVDIYFNLYVVDHGNSRIQLFKPGSSNGITLVGSNTSEWMSLEHPTDIKIDADGNLFIVDKNNHRIVRYGSNGLHCLIGCAGTVGSGSHQLNSPYGIAFDTFGNIFVLDENNDRIEKFLLARNNCIPYNQPKICSNATWNENGTTLADQKMVGNMPHGIFVDSNDTVYVGANGKNQILMWFDGSIDPFRNLSATKFDYLIIFVNTHGDIYFPSGTEKGIVNKWTWNLTSSVRVANFTDDCYGLFIDNNNTLYCSMHKKHKVVKMSFNDNINTIVTVAGTDSSGSASNQLSYPWGIFVDMNFDLYVADAQNNRILRFKPGQTNGITVAGGGTPNNLTLLHPTDVVLDADGYLFIADNNHHRIIRSGPDDYECIAGCPGNEGSAPNQLHKPYALRFDSYGNIYVADEYNHRIQKFTLATNFCETSITTNSPLERTTTSSFMTHQQVEDFSPFFIPRTCKNTTNIGFNCNISTNPCDMIKPCQNGGTCSITHTTQYGYHCSCPTGFNGTHCDLDYRPCKPYTCFSHGTCNETSNTTFNCTCENGWQGIHCETKINYCINVKCLNNGICRPLLLNYTCECLGDSYSGRHCEITATRIFIYKILSKSFAYVAILAMTIVAMFVVIMDLLKYCFGIDPTRDELERMRREKQARKQRRCMAQRFVDVNATSQASEVKSSTIKETTK